MKGQTMRRDKINYSATTRILLMTSVLVFWPLSSIPLQADVVSLADIVGGGDGSGNGTDSGIDLETGLQTTAHFNWQKFIPTNNYVAAANPFVDGVFIPDGGATQSNVIQVSSTGLTVTGISDSTGFLGGSSAHSYDNIWNGDNFGLSTGLSGDLMGAHANKGITFDLDAIEAHYGQLATSYDMLAATGSDTGAHADYYLFIDGVLEHSVLLSGADQSFNFSGSLDSSDRFLTLITSANGTLHADWSYWIDSTVTVQAIPEPSSATMFIVLCAMAMPWQRRKS